MQDSQGRQLRYLRLSLTRACAMRCIYCRPGAWRPTDGCAPLTADEIERLVGHLVRYHGLRKLRLTGGEPSMRPDLLDILNRVCNLGMEDVGLTTNGMTLQRDAMQLRKAGLKRINISLDSLDRQHFARITGQDSLDTVVAGIHAAIAAGFSPIRLNTVVLREENDHDLADLVSFAAKLAAEIRFIELMPMGPLAKQWERYYVPESEMREQLAGVMTDWTPLDRIPGAARRHVATLAGGQEVTIGFISAMSHPFCDACDRIRIASDGGFYPCLMDRPAENLLASLRPVFRPDVLDQMLACGFAHKAAMHPAHGYSPMIQIGG